MIVERFSIIILFCNFFFSIFCFLNIFSIISKSFATYVCCDPCLLPMHQFLLCFIVKHNKVHRTKEAQLTTHWNSPLQPPQMAPLSTFRWQNRKERRIRSTSSGYMIDKAKRDVVSEWVCFFLIIEKLSS